MINVPPSKVPFGGTASYGLTAGLGGSLAFAFASTHGPDAGLWPVLSIRYDLSTTPACSVSSALVPSCGAWFGSTTNQIGGETTPGDAVARQESELGRRLDIVHVYHSGSDNWPTQSEVALSSDRTNPRLLMVNWKPENGSTWAQVAAGANDVWIDTVASRIGDRLGSMPFFLTIHHEPEQEVRGDGSGFTPADYVAMFRHVVLRLQGDGVANAVIVWDMMGYSGWGDQGFYDVLYPGDDVVDWIGYDPYSHNGAPLVTFANRPGRAFPGFYSWATSVHPGKPLMLGEFGVDSPSDRSVSVFSSLAAQGDHAGDQGVHLFQPRSGLDDKTDSTGHESDPTVLAGGRAAFSDPYFQH